MKVISNQELDKEFWDKLMREAKAPIYQYSWYLDAVFPNWKAVISDNNNLYFPICQKKKLGISYLFQPKFSQKFEVVNSMSGILNMPNSLTDFLQKNFPFAEIMIGTKPQSNEIVKRSRKNMFIQTYLDRPIDSDFSINVKRKIKKASTYSSLIEINNDWNYFFHFYKSTLPENLTLSESDFESIHRLTKAADSIGSLQTFYHLNVDREPIGVVLTVSDNNRSHLLLSSNTEVGMKLGSTAYIIQHILNKVRLTSGIFDFEGSEIPGVKHFYSLFKPTEEEYYFVSWNHLPFPLNLLKK